MTYRPEEADLGDLVIQAVLFVFLLGVFVGGMKFVIAAIGSVFGSIGLHW